MELEREFEESLRSYVSGEDVRRKILLLMLKIPPNRILEEELIEVYDFAALMTCCTFLDPKNSAGERLFLSYRQYVQKREEAKEAFVDPDKIPFHPDLEGLEIVLDSTLPALKAFVETLSGMDRGKIYLAKTIVCIACAHNMPHITSSLWRPLTKTGGVTCLLQS